MNINPKKSWHVRSKTNIAKVSADEAKVAAEENEKKRRIELAQSDERWTHLKRTAKARGLGGDDESGAEPLDFFKDVKRGVDGVVAESAEFAAEKKVDQEKWEKKIGLLKYLGEGAAEFSAEKPWWMIASKRSSAQSNPSQVSLEAFSERDKQFKLKEDPLADVKKSIKQTGLQKHGNMHTISSSNNAVATSSSPSTSKSVDQLRRERLERERRERERSQTLLASHGIIPQPKQVKNEYDERKRPYNSAFNAHIIGNLRR